MLGSFACNSPKSISNFGIQSLKFQRFESLWVRGLRELHAILGEVCPLGSAGRVLYRLRPYTLCARRVLYRGVCAAWLVSGGLRDKILPASVVSVSTGIIFSLLASNGLIWVFFAVLGEFCTGCGLTRCVPGEFCTVGVRCVASVWWSARENSPCFECLRRKRDIFRPALRKKAKTAEFCRAGRVFSRCVPDWGFAGRVLSRGMPMRPAYTRPTPCLHPVRTRPSPRATPHSGPIAPAAAAPYPWPVKVRYTRNRLSATMTAAMRKPVIRRGRLLT